MLRQVYLLLLDTLPIYTGPNTILKFMEILYLHLYLVFQSHQPFFIILQQMNMLKNSKKRKLLILKLVNLNLHENFKNLIFNFKFSKRLDSLAGWRVGKKRLVFLSQKGGGQVLKYFLFTSSSHQRICSGAPCSPPRR